MANTTEAINIFNVSTQINICIVDSTFKEIKRKYYKNKSHKQKRMSHDEFKEATEILYKCCLTGVKDLHELHLRRSLGVEILDDIIERADPDFIKIPCIIHIMWSIMSIICHFQTRLRTIALELIIWNRNRQAEKCFETYIRLIRKINPKLHRVALNSIITMYREGRMWEIEFTCTNLIIKLLILHTCAEKGLEDLIITIEICLVKNIKEAKYLTQVLYSVLEKLKWKKISLNLLTKLIMMTESSISPKPTDLYSYVPLRDGLLSCFRNITTNLNEKDLIVFIYFFIRRLVLVENMDEEVTKALGNAVIYAAKVYKLYAVRKPLIKGPLPLVLSLLNVNKPYLTLLALRVWKHLIDRGDNLHTFRTPQVFFQECKYNIVKRACLKTDKYLFKSFRYLILNISFRCFEVAESMMFLENVYQFIALTLVEIPCGYTASCFVTVAMGMQEYAFTIMKKNLTKANNFHAIVMAIMTLICYIHKASSFYEYVNTIMERRAEMAPHLNPPLKTTYTYATHHILWIKQELFFEDWETRHGLWQCFRRREKSNTKTPETTKTQVGEIFL